MYEPHFILQRAANQPGVCGQLSRATQPAVITVTCVVDVTAFCTGLRIHVILSISGFEFSFYRSDSYTFSKIKT